MRRSGKAVETLRTIEYDEQGVWLWELQYGVSLGWWLG